MGASRINHRFARRLLPLAIVLCLTACTDLFAQAISDQVVNNLLALESYRAQITETGLVQTDPKAKVVRKVVYQKPWKVRAETLEPQTRAGDLFIYDGETMVFWYPNEMFGIRVRGLESPPVPQIRDHVESLTRYNMKNYAWQMREPLKIAGYEATPWKAVPMEKLDYLYPYTSAVYNRYSLPLKVEITTPKGDPWYRMEFEKAGFDVAVDPGDFTFEFPRNAVVFEWDHRDEGITIDEAKASMNFDVRLPEYLPPGVERKKIIRSRHCLPMISLIMGRDASYLSLTQNRAAGETPAEMLGKRIRIGDRDGYLNFSGGFASVMWTQGNTQLTLVGNYPYPELIKIARSVK